MAPGTTDVQAPFEAQGRGFVNGHGKGHSVIGPTLAWLRSVVRTGLRAAGRRLREAILSKAETVQYPEEKPYLAPRYRGRIVLTRDPDGEERCVACNLCAAVCPVDCI